MKFRDDISLSDTWIVSDTHFGHDNLVGYCARPEDHEQVMIAEWRKCVPDHATVLHLGDLAYSSNGRFKHLIAKELTGARKLLIQGNHDRQRYSFYKGAGFNIVRPFKLRVGEFRDLDFQGLMIVPDEHPDAVALTDYIISFSHYPWNTAEDGHMLDWDVRIHGHIHNSGYTRDAYVPFLKNHINLSVEQTRYRPVNLGLLLNAALLGQYPETTDEQLADARDRKEAAKDAAS